MKIFVFNNCVGVGVQSSTHFGYKMQLLNKTMQLFSIILTSVWELSKTDMCATLNTICEQELHTLRWNLDRYLSKKFSSESRQSSTPWNYLQITWKLLSLCFWFCLCKPSSVLWLSCANFKTMLIETGYLCFVFSSYSMRDQHQIRKSAVDRRLLSSCTVNSGQRVQRVRNADRTFRYCRRLSMQSFIEVDILTRVQ